MNWLQTTPLDEIVCVWLDTIHDRCWNSMAFACDDCILQCGRLRRSQETNFVNKICTKALNQLIKKLPIIILICTHLIQSDNLKALILFGIFLLCSLFKWTNQLSVFDLIAGHLGIFKIFGCFEDQYNCRAKVKFAKRFPFCHRHVVHVLIIVSVLSPESTVSAQKLLQWK